jgi:hypothetical protein
MESRHHAVELVHLGVTVQRGRAPGRREPAVPSADKIVSIFEPHTDIIITDRRETLYRPVPSLGEVVFETE